jgi:hypothetical protein
MRLVVVATLCAVSIGTTASAYYAYPQWTLKLLADAAGRRDADAIARHIDWPAVREDLKANLQLAVMDQFKGDQSGFAAIGGLLGATMIDKTIDVLVSPAGLEKIYRNAANNPPPNLTIINPGFVAVDEYRGVVLQDGVEWSTVTLRLEGLRWKIVRLTPSKEAMQALGPTVPVHGGADYEYDPATMSLDELSKRKTGQQHRPLR